MNMESKTIFRPISAQSDKYTYSSNTVHGCNKCLKTKPPGQAPFHVCAGCKCTRYCTRVCQKADWRDHKFFCKKKQHAFEVVQNVDESLLPVAMRDCQERALLVEDFARAHTFTFQSALQALIAFAPPFDFRQKYALVELKERATHDGNPATRYEVVDITLCHNPTASSTDEIMREAFIQNIYPTYSYWEKMYSSNPHVWGLLIVMYRVGTMSPWPLPLGVSKPYPAPTLFDRDTYKATAKEFTGKGIVFRLIKDVRKQGVLEKSGENWVWKEKTPQELRDNYGVDITGAFIDPLQLRASTM